MLLTTSGAAGGFSFPGASVGPFAVSASSPDVAAQASATGAIARAGQLLDVTLVASIDRQVFGSVSGVVTLRGPVDSTAEKATVEAAAKRVSGVTKVDSQIEVDTD